MFTDMTIHQRQLVRTYWLYSIVTNLWFLSAVWLYFYHIYVTDQQVGVLDGLAFAIGILAEVPAGALADTFGRDKMVRLGQALAGIGLIVQIAGAQFWAFVLGQSIMMVGVSFVSGADEALFFQNLKFDRESRQWRRLVTRCSQVALAATLVATLAGGWLYTLDPRLPWLATGISFLLSVIVIWPVRDTRPRRERRRFREETAHYVQAIATGFRMFGQPALRRYAVLIVAVQGLFYATGYGLLRLVLMNRFGFDAFWSSLVIASCSLISVGVLAVLHRKAETVSEKSVLLGVAAGAAMSLMAALFTLGYWGYAVILVLYVGERVLYPTMSEVLNRHSPEDQRATVLSVASFLKSAPYVVLGPIIGYLSTHDQLNVFLGGWAGVIVLAMGMYMWAVRPRPA